jgi:hypothetical protein
MLSQLKAAVAWLSVNVDPAVPRALLVLAVLVVVYAFRKLFPRAWEAFASVVPVPVIDAAPVLLVLSKFWQALPGTLLGMTTLALSTGGDVSATIKGAVFGALAALAHEVLKAVPWVPYRGEVGRMKPPTLLVLHMLSLVLFGLAALCAVACRPDAEPCSTEDYATGPLALHNTKCAARRQSKFPNLPDDKCDATPGCKAIVAECDRWVEERCK